MQWNEINFPLLTEILFALLVIHCDSLHSQVCKLCFLILNLFDIANRDFILEQLANFGIEEKLLTWIQTYISNRSVDVLFKGGKSSWFKVFELATPQGGHLVPRYSISIYICGWSTTWTWYLPSFLTRGDIEQLHSKTILLNSKYMHFTKRERIPKYLMLPEFSPWWYTVKMVPKWGPSSFSTSVLGGGRGPPHTDGVRVISYIPSRRTQYAAPLKSLKIPDDKYHVTGYSWCCKEAAAGVSLSLLRRLGMAVQDFVLDRRSKMMK